MDTILWIIGGIISLLVGLFQFIIAAWMIVVIYQLIFNRDKVAAMGENYIKAWEGASKGDK